MIVGYAGVFVTFAIMISIVIGLMSRLIKGAALLLGTNVYATGNDAIKAVQSQLSESLTYQGGRSKPKLEGDALQKQIAGDQKKAADKQTELLKEISQKLDQQNKNNNTNNNNGSST